MKRMVNEILSLLKVAYPKTFLLCSTHLDNNKKTNLNDSYLTNSQTTFSSFFFFKLNQTNHMFMVRWSKEFQWPLWFFRDSEELHCTFVKHNVKARIRDMLCGIYHLLVRFVWEVLMEKSRLI